MKSKLTVLAIALFFLAQNASAQQSRNGNRDNDRNHGTQQNNNYNHDRNEPDYGARRIRNDRNRPVMTARAFNDAMMSIRRERFDSDKIKLARLLAARNNMTTMQIKTMAQAFGFDSSKLEFTKYAYASCIDPQNYYQIGRIFSFSSSKRELYDYLARV